MIKSEQEWLKKKETVRKKDFPYRIRQRLTSWLDRKEKLLEQVQEVKLEHGDSSIIYEEKLTISSELEELEHENRALYERLQVLQADASERRQHESLILEKENRTKEQYLNGLAEKNDLVTEVSFLQEELQRIDKDLSEAEKSYQINMEELGLLIEQIRFVSGEVEVLSEKMVSLEDEVPQQHLELTYINDQIESANQALFSLSDRLQAIEYHVKTAYYKGKGRK